MTTELDLLRTYMGRGDRPDEPERLERSLSQLRRNGRGGVSSRPPGPLAQSRHRGRPMPPHRRRMDRSHILINNVALAVTPRLDGFLVAVAITDEQWSELELALPSIGGSKWPSWRLVDSTTSPFPFLTQGDRPTCNV